jgi:RepB DNA-primase from phage plasmid/CHC2 zinc finger
VKPEDTYSTDPERAAELYLRMLRASAPPYSLLDVRYRVRGRDLARFFVPIKATNVASTITRIGRRTDVYVGVAPRVRRSGRREDIAPTSLLWADCDEPTAVAALLAFQHPASMIVTSGGGENGHKNVHAYWALTRPLTAEALEDANRRLAAAIGADPKCADPARVLRVPGSLSFKRLPPRPVELLRYTKARYPPEEILRGLPLSRPPPTRGKARRLHNRRARPDSDPLLMIEPTDYVFALTGCKAGRDGKIRCPFHDDHTPSLHVYPSPERGWTCFGCTNLAGRPLGGDIYTLASLVWRIPASGRDFLTLRARLEHLFGVRR